jgi:hypothetical protein
MKDDILISVFSFQHKHESDRGWGGGGSMRLTLLAKSILGVGDVDTGDKGDT